MIHGYLFLTNNNRDRDGHGTEFCKHMERINGLAGTKITIYHTFHDEVWLYKQHWWRCNGPCQKRAPYFGTVRRAMNRTPGPSDFWWKEHEASCNGTFIKIKEPEKKEKSKERGGKSLIGSNRKVNKSVTTTKSTSNSSNNSNVSGSSDQKSGLSTVGSSGFVKLGTNTNKVYGFGTGGPGSASGFTSSILSVTSQSTKKRSSSSCSGTLGGAGTGKSNLLDKFLTGSTSLKTNTNGSSTLSLPSPPREKKKQNSLAIFLSPTSKNQNENSTTSLLPPRGSPKRRRIDDSMHFCPICSTGFLPGEINAHVDKCLLGENHPEPTNKTNKKPMTMDQSRINLKSQNTLDGYLKKNKNDNLSSDQICEKQKSHCVVCNASVLISKMSDHLDICLKSPDPKKASVIEDNVFEIPDSDDDDIFKLPERTTPSNQSTNENEENFFICLVCNELVSKDIPLEIHLESCIHGIYEDFENDVVSPVKSSPNNDGKYPCPVCMTMINEKIMNQHLDTCIQ